MDIQNLTIYYLARMAGFSEKDIMEAIKGRCAQNNGDNECPKGETSACCYEICEPEEFCGASCLPATGREHKNCPDYMEVSINAKDRKAG